MFCSFFIDMQAPKIKCPEGVSVSTDKGKSFATVTWKVPEPTDNSEQQPDLTVYPAHITSPPYQFNVGQTFVKYTAEDSAGHQSSCTFSVTVNGKYCEISMNSPPGTICCVLVVVRKGGGGLTLWLKL